MYFSQDDFAEAFGKLDSRQKELAAEGLSMLVRSGFIPAVQEMQDDRILTRIHTSPEQDKEEVHSNLVEYRLKSNVMNLIIAFHDSVIDNKDN